MSPLLRRAVGSRTSDRGAGSIEYVGVVIVVVVLIAGVMAAVRASDVGATIAERMTCAVRSVGTQAGDCGGDDAPTYYGDEPEVPRAGGADADGGDDALWGPDRGLTSALTGRDDTDDSRDAEGNDGPDYDNAADVRPVASPDDVARALGQVRDALDGGFWGVRSGDLADARDAITDLNGAEMDAVIAGMSDDELKHWVNQMEDGLGFSGWSREERRELWELLARRASKDTLDRLSEFTDELQPSFSDVGGKEMKKVPLAPRNAGEYGEIPHELFVRGISPRDIDQGAIGDCWWMASLAGVAQADSGIIEDAITANPNGTYTVRLYEDGEPVDITVTPDMVLVDGAPALAQSLNYVLSDDKTLGYELWPMVMEKALAVHYGDYEKIEGGWPADGMTALTGRESKIYEPEDLSIERLEQTLADGGAVALGSLTKDDGKKSPYYQHSAGAQMLMADHAYYVQGVNTRTGTVTVVNPWGIMAYPPITMPYADYLEQFRRVDVNEVS